MRARACVFENGNIKVNATAKSLIDFSKRCPQISVKIKALTNGFRLENGKAVRNFLGTADENDFVYGETFDKQEFTFHGSHTPTQWGAGKSSDGVISPLLAVATHVASFVK